MEATNHDIVPSPDGWAPYAGNFSTGDFTYWPDKSTKYTLEFQPPGFESGKFCSLSLTFVTTWRFDD